MVDELHIIYTRINKKCDYLKKYFANLYSFFILSIIEFAIVTF